jgi:hypothetical protein
MPQPYFLMSLLYLSLVALSLLASMLTGLEIIPLFGSLKWLRVHLVTLGALSEITFGLVPVLAASRHRLPRPKMRWDIWLSLNAGLVLLLIGIPTLTHSLIVTGGTLIGIATVLLTKQLIDLRPLQASRANASDGRTFYITSLSYLVIGGLVGTGLWLGWSQTLHIAAPIEVHVHTNLWGFTALMLAGLVVDLYPSFAHRPLPFHTFLGARHICPFGRSLAEPRYGPYRKYSILGQSILSWGRGNRTRLGLWILDPLRAPNFGGFVEEFPFRHRESCRNSGSVN